MKNNTFVKKLIFLSCLVIVGLTSCSDNDGVTEYRSLSQGWTVTTDTLDLSIDVSLPSVIQNDLYEAGLIPHPYHGKVEQDLLWIPQREWTYRLVFDMDDLLMSKDNIELIFDGIDTYADVWLNGNHLLYADNMFRTWSADVKDVVKPSDNELVVRFLPFDKVRDSLIKTYPLRFPEKYAVMRKAGYQNGWDWAPRYLNIGLWKPVSLRAWSGISLSDASVATVKLSDNEAMMSLHATIDSDVENPVEICVLQGEDVILNEMVELSKGKNEISLPFVMENPRLWYPNGMGEQNLYDFDIKILRNGMEKDVVNVVTGIRDIRLVNEPDSIGAAMYFTVNGSPLYIKGSNYVPEEMLTARMSRDNTLYLIRECVEANFNMLRIWGGGIYPPDYFYDICDSLGIMVWQDFMFAGSTYPYSDEFLDNVREEAVQQVKRYRSHPSLALWCGNNEISEGYYNWGWQKSLGWSEAEDKEMKDGYDRLFEEILEDVVEKYDGTRSYWPSSPSKGWGRPESLTEGDVHYWGVWWGEMPYEIYRDKVGRFNSEFGYQAYPSVSTLRKIDPALDNDVIQAHQKHARGELLMMKHVREYIGKPKDFEDYVYMSQLSQEYGLSIAVEAQRAAKPRSMGSLYWQLNDAWPVISWSSIDYYGNKKALQYRLKELFAPLYVGIKTVEDKYVLWVNNDNQTAFEGLLLLDVKDMKGKTVFSQKLPINIERNGCHDIELGDDFCRAVRHPERIYVKMTVDDNDGKVFERLCFLTKPKDLKLKKTDITYDVLQDDGTVTLKVRSSALAKSVYVECRNAEGRFSDNFFDLEPQNEKVITFVPENDTDVNDMKFIFTTLNP